jgi:uncharacterized protein (TIGR01777 family)
MNAVFAMLTFQCLLGAFDNFWHHELEADLPHEPGARTELALHAARELLYALIFGSTAWWQWNGAWGLLLIAILVTEVIITISDFVVEDRTRRLPALERVLHTVLALSYGATIALWMPTLQRWLLEPTGFASTQYGVWSWLMSLFAAGVFFWGLRDLFAVSRLGVPQWQRNPMQAGACAAPRVILLTGATGFIGRALTRALVARGDHVIALSRSPQRARDQFGPWVEVCSNLDEIGPHRQIDAIVNLAGEPVAGFWWTAARRRRLVHSRLQVTRQLVEMIKRLQYKPRVLVSASAIGFYGDRGDDELHEGSGDRDGFLSELCRRWEAAAMKAERLGVRVVRLRIGLVLGRGGGVLQPLALASRCGAGAVLGGGRQWLSWIHLQDLVRMIDFSIGNENLSGVCNAVAPQAVTQRDLVQQIASTLHRLLLLRVPAVALKLLAGEMSDLFLVSQRVIPQRMQHQGFHFDHPVLDAALADLLGRSSRVAAAVVYANEQVAICRAEMAFYSRLADRRQRELAVRSIHSDAVELRRFGLATTDLRRRLFVQQQDGTVCSGFDALIAIWRLLPGWRLLAAVTSQPGIHQLCAMLYDLALAPLLRQRQQPGRTTPICMTSSRSAHR